MPTWVVGWCIGFHGRYSSTDHGSYLPLACGPWTIFGTVICEVQALTCETRVQSFLLNFHVLHFFSHFFQLKSSDFGRWSRNYSGCVVVLGFIVCKNPVDSAKCNQSRLGLQLEYADRKAGQWLVVTPNPQMWHKQAEGDLIPMPSHDEMQLLTE